MKKTVSPITPEATPSALRPEVAAAYTVRKGLTNVFACAEFGRVDLSEVTLPFAEQLSARGYLIQKKLHQADA